MNVLCLYVLYVGCSWATDDPGQSVAGGPAQQQQRHAGIVYVYSVYMCVEGRFYCACE